MKIKPSGIKKVIKQDYTIPEGFILIIDTREQDNLFRKPPKGLLIVRDTLQSGDYSIKGFEQDVAIERKSLNDFYGSIGKGRSRFKAELERLRKYDWKAILIEGTEDQVLSVGSIYTQLTHAQVRQSIVSFEVKYKLAIYYAKSRQDSERWILDRLIKWFNYKREGEV